MKTRLVPRPRYMAWLQRWKDRQVIKVVTGMRRSGKSCIFELFRGELRSQGVPDTNIQSINFESLDEEYPTTARELYRYIVQRLEPGINYVFLDEVQHVEGFERAVDGLALREDVDLYITGSNAYLLSSNLATLLTGRYVELRMLPFSFAEYLSARADESNPDTEFNRYITYGGMPFAAQLDDERSILDYLGGVFSTIVLEDVARRHPRIDMRQRFWQTTSATSRLASASLRDSPPPGQRQTRPQSATTLTYFWKTTCCSRRSAMTYEDANTWRRSRSTTWATLAFASGCLVRPRATLAIASRTPFTSSCCDAIVACPSAKWELPRWTSSRRAILDPSTSK